MKKPQNNHRAREIILKGIQKEPQILRLSGSSSRLRVRATRASRSALLVELDPVKPATSVDMEVRLEPGAEFTLVFLCSGSSSPVITQRVQVTAGASLHLLNVTLCSARHSLESMVTGKDASSSLSWIIRARGKDQCDLSVRTVFSAARGRGDTVVRGVCGDRARVSCRGAIAVTPEGGGTQTHLSERFLLLDPEAQADAVPELKIETDNVRAGHSAAVSRLSDEDLFYFASRGIPEKKARGMLVEGFFGEIIERISDERLRKMVWKKLR